MVVAIPVTFGAIGRFPRNTVANGNGGAKVEEGRGHDGQALPRKALCSSPAGAGRAYVMGVWDGGLEAIQERLWSIQEC